MHPAGIPTIPPRDAAAATRPGGRRRRRTRPLIVDVREPDEFASERVEGAVLMPLSQFADATRSCRRTGRSDELPLRQPLGVGDDVPAAARLDGRPERRRRDRRLEAGGLPVRRARRSRARATSAVAARMRRGRAGRGALRPGRAAPARGDAARAIPVICVACGRTPSR